MAGHHVDPTWSGARATYEGQYADDALGLVEGAGDWDDPAASGGAGESCSWHVATGSGLRVRTRHARKRPSFALRTSVVVLACAVIASLVGATIYRLDFDHHQITSAAKQGGTARIAPVITLFAPDGSTQSQAGAGSVAPLPVTSTSAPSQYLAPDKASDYELSLIAASGAPEKAIVVSRFSQTIHVYQNGQFIAGSYAITGRPELPTPIGVYQIFLKVAPAVLYSPWPPGSPFFYPPAPVNYTMEFRAGGFLIHDAPWHHVWGPGMNDWHYDSGAKEWQWGTHGCVTAPTPFIQWLYNWSPDGTTVIIY